MKLTNVIRIWDCIHHKTSGELSFSDLEFAIEKTVGIENDIPTDLVTLNYSRRKKAKK